VNKTGEGKQIGGDEKKQCYSSAYDIEAWIHNTKLVFDT